MKKNILILFFLIAGISAVNAQARSTRDLLGKWKGKEMQLEFFNDQRVSMILPGGKIPKATYQVNFMSNPIALTITLADNGQTMTYKGSIEFINNETIKLLYFGADNANDAFAKERNITLVKGK